MKVIKDDRDKYNHENTKLLEKKEISEKERKKLISELKDFKLRESRLLTENNELDEENISLQKQVSMLKSSQVDIETYKVEIASLQGIIETMQNQIDENKNLKQIAEKQVITFIFFKQYYILFVLHFRRKTLLKRCNRNGNRNMP